MKNLKKVLVASLVSLLMVFNVVAVAGAATTYKNGTYVAEYPGSVTYKLNVTVAGGVITEANLQLFYGATELTSAVSQVKGIFDSWAEWCAELVKTNDASKVTGADEAFMACAADFEEQAGKKVTADTTATPTVAPEATVAPEEDAAVEEDTTAADTEEDAAVEEDTTAADTEEDAAVEEDTTASDTEDAAVEEDTAADTTAASSTSIPKTGVVGLGLVYGLGVLATGAYSLKRKEK